LLDARRSKINGRLPLILLQNFAVLCNQFFTFL